MSSTLNPTLQVIDPKENITYEFVPGPDHDQDWHIRIMDGMYNETVIKYGAISFNEIEEGSMSFNYHIISSPDTDLTEDDIGLQETAGSILQHIIKEAIEKDDGTLALKEKEE